jgi:hypothetical protein
MPRDIPAKFLVAFSFAGEQRELVRSIAEPVEDRLGWGTVFYDDWFEHYIAGSDADIRLQQIYGEKAELIVVCVSGSYGDKPWTLAEHEAVRARQMRLRASADPKDAFRILPIRTGEGDLKTFPFNTIIPDVRQRRPSNTARLIMDRLRQIVPEEKHIFLAECMPDLNDSRERLRAFLEELGWIVLPIEKYSEHAYESRLQKDLRMCRAFVQLIGPTPCGRCDCDRVQNEAAGTLELPRFRYRSPDLDISSVAPEHRQFITASDIIVTGFEDFKLHLQKKLSVASQKSVGNDDDESDILPRVGVVIRSPNPEPIWAKVFEWIYADQKLDICQLRPGETFEARLQTEPFHGFLVACDAASLEDGPHSPREDMEQCRVIQMKVKIAVRRPPVALIYWPPPPASPAGWAKLMRSTPRPLHLIAADAPGELVKYFEEVRRVAQCA